MAFVQPLFQKKNPTIISKRKSLVRLIGHRKIHKPIFFTEYSNYSQIVELENPQHNFCSDMEMRERKPVYRIVKYNPKIASIIISGSLLNKNLNIYIET